MKNAPVESVEHYLSIAGKNLTEAWKLAREDDFYHKVISDITQALSLTLSVYSYIVDLKRRSK